VLPSPFDLPRLYNSFAKDVDLHIERVKSQFERKDPTWDTYKGKKTLYHSLRWIEFGIQLAETQRIVDFTAGNDMRESLMHLQQDSWEECHAVFYSTFQRRKDNFYHLCHCK